MYKIINEQEDSNIVLVHKLHKHETNLIDVLFIPWIRLSINKQSSFFKNGEITKFNVICKISKDKVLCMCNRRVLRNNNHFRIFVSIRSSIAKFLHFTPIVSYFIRIKSNYIPIHSKDTQWRLKKQSQELVGYWGRS